MYGDYPLRPSQLINYQDSLNARVCPQYLPLISAAPLVAVLCVLISNVLRLAIPYRPKWTKPFVEEFKDKDEVEQPTHKWHWNLSTISLFLISTCGLTLQVVLIWNRNFHLDGLYPALTWVCCISSRYIRATINLLRLLLHSWSW